MGPSANNGVVTDEAVCTMMEGSVKNTLSSVASQEVRKVVFNLYFGKLFYELSTNKITTL